MSLLVLSISMVIFFLFPSPVFAAQTISTTEIDPKQMLDTEERTVTVTVDTTSTANAYIRPVFFKRVTSGSAKYFGCAKTSTTDFVCGTDSSIYPQLTGSGTIQITVKVDKDSTNYLGEGDYLFKVLRCTSSSCSLESTEQEVHITRIATPSPSPTPTPTSTPTPTPVPTPTPPSSKVFLSEIMPCSGAGVQDWIELHNSGSTSVTLTDWVLRNEKNKEQKFSLTLEKKGYAFVEVSRTLFEDKDTVTLVTNEGNIVDTYAYNYAESGSTCDKDLSFAKSTQWKLTTTPTQGKANVISPPKSIPTPTPFSSPTASSSGEVLGISEEEASVSALQLRDISDEDQPEHAGSVVRRIPPQALYLAYLSIGIGITCLTCAGVLFYRDWYNRKKKRKRKK